MENEKEILYIVCARTSETPAGNAIKTATVTNCEKCSEPVWISPSSKKTLADNSDQEKMVVCIHCFQPISEKEKVETEGITKRQVVEIIDHYKTGESKLNIYQLVMGRNPESPLLIGCLGITGENAEEWPLGRIRDVWLSPDGSKISILHRNYTTDENNVNHPELLNMGDHPLFVRAYNANEDVPPEISHQDTTYWVWEFSLDHPDVNETLKEKLRELAKEIDQKPPYFRFLQIVKDMSDDTKINQPHVQEAIQRGMKVMLAEFMANAKDDQNIIVDALDSDHPEKGKIPPDSTVN